MGEVKKTEIQKIDPLQGITPIAAFMYAKEIGYSPAREYQDLGFFNPRFFIQLCRFASVVL
jgi:hypothetical protein